MNKKHNEYMRGYRLKNKEKLKEAKRLYNFNNKEKINEKQRNYIKTPEGKKANRITQWKSVGVIAEDLGAVYDYYILETNCMICNKKYKEQRAIPFIFFCL